MPDEPASLRLYRWFLKLYPATFRENYAEFLELEFRDELRESTGTAALCMLWIRLIADLAISVLLQLVREAAQDARHTVRLWSRQCSRRRGFERAIDFSARGQVLEPYVARNRRRGESNLRAPHRQLQRWNPFAIRSKL